MPEISLFYGIRITMFYSDHNPPHFHAEYAGSNAWCELHRDELMQNWELAKDAKPLNHIAPLV